MNISTLSRPRYAKFVSDASGLRSSIHSPLNLRAVKLVSLARRDKSLTSEEQKSKRFNFLTNAEMKGQRSFRDKKLLSYFPGR